MKTDCLTCHAFAPKQAVPTCISCHARAEGPLAAIATHATTACSDCHRMHEDRSPVSADIAASSECKSCHKELARSTRTTPEPGMR